MKLWEIAKGMSEGRYEEGDRFENGSIGVIVIYDGSLIYEDDMGYISIVLSDMEEWVEL